MFITVLQVRSHNLASEMFAYAGFTAIAPFGFLHHFCASLIFLQAILQPKVQINLCCHSVAINSQL